MYGYFCASHSGDSRDQDREDSGIAGEGICGKIELSRFPRLGQGRFGDRWGGDLLANNDSGDIKLLNILLKLFDVGALYNLN
jgi:hypothetical protein